MKINEVLPLEHIELSLTAVNKKDLLIKMCEIARRSGKINNLDVVKKQVIEREEFMTGWREFLPKNTYPVLQDWSDFLETDGKQFSISVAESRYISKILSLKAYEGGYKIMILWLPEYMNASAVVTSKKEG